ncbi:glycosyl hydrolase family 28-related protein [Acidobacteriota bacterium]
MKNILAAAILLVFSLTIPGFTRSQEKFVYSLAVSRYANVYDFGARGDGETDDTRAIQDALDSLKEFRINGMAQVGSCAGKPAVRLLDMTLAGRDVPGSVGRFAVSQPILIESDYQASPRESMDGVVVWGYGAELIALPGFRGIQRLRRSDRWEMHLALLVIGPKNYAASGGPFQRFNGVHGLAFSGHNLDGDLAGIRLDVCSRAEVKDCVFKHLHKAVDGRAVSSLLFLQSRAKQVNSLCYIKNDSAWLGWNDGLGVPCRGPRIASFTVRDSRDTWPEILPPKYTNMGKIHCINLDGGTIQDGKIIQGSGKGIYIAREKEPTDQAKRWWKLSCLKITDMYHEALHIKKQTRVHMADVQAYRNQSDFRAGSRGGGACIHLQNVEKIEWSDSLVDQRPTQGHMNGYGGHIVLIQGQVAITDCVFKGIPVKNNAFSAVRICHGATWKGNNCLVSGCRICSDLTPDVPGARYTYGIEAPMGSVGHVFTGNIISGYWIAPVSWY